MNEVVPNEPAVFNIVRQILAQKHYDLALKETPEKAINEANNQTEIKDINEKLEWINLKLEIEFIEQRNWSYRFKIIETLTDTGTIITDINHLSAGQKAILHLILESYARGKLNGGVVIIDEPELHLHCQFQYEFLKLIEQFANEFNTQYILVTHSEGFISSQTINSVTRLALNAGATNSYSPRITKDNNLLVKILDNARSVNALFCNKVLLVEGEDDRYFFREAINLLYPDKRQEIFILDVSGKAKFDEWRTFFEKFGLKVYIIADLDIAINKFYSEEYGNNPPKLVSKGNDTNLHDHFLAFLEKPPNTQEKSHNFYFIYRDAKENMRVFNVRNKKLSPNDSDISFLVCQQQEPIKSKLDAQYSSFTEDLTSINLDKSLEDLIKSNFMKEILIDDFRKKHSDLDQRVDDEYKNGLFILKHGAIEDYLENHNKGISEVIKFCKNMTKNRFNNNKCKELKQILQRILSE